MEQSCRILVVGGSLGAKVLNDELPAVFSQLNVIKPVEVWHQTGKGNLGSVKEAYQDLALSTKVEQFIDDIDEAYAWADIVVCRSGALTVSEVSAAGVGAIFIPFMHKDRQQALNADHLVQGEAAKMIEQQDLTPQLLADTLLNLDREQLLTMAKNARNAAIIDADVRVAEAIKSLAVKN